MTCPCREALSLVAALHFSQMDEETREAAREALAEPCWRALSEEGRGSDGTDEGTPSVRLHGTAVPPSVPSSESALSEGGGGAGSIPGGTSLSDPSSESASGVWLNEKEMELMRRGLHQAQDSQIANEALALLRERSAR